jgi:tetratricopeptide (TPR) repeat protein
MERYMDAEARFLHADTLIERGEIVEAKAVLEELINDEPDYGRAHNHLGWIIRTRFSDFERAAYHLRLAVKFAPEYPAGYINYARLLLEMGEFSHVEKLTRKALEVKGMNKVDAYYFLAVAVEMNQGAAEGMKYLLKAREFAVDENAMNFIKGEIKRLKGKLNTLGRIALLF